MRNESTETPEQTISIGKKTSNALKITSKLLLLGTQPPLTKTFESKGTIIEATRFPKRNPSCGKYNNIQLSKELIEKRLNKSKDQSENAAMDCMVAKLCYILHTTKQHSAIT